MPYKAGGCATVVKEGNIYVTRGKKYNSGWKYIDTVVVFEIKTTSWMKQLLIKVYRFWGILLHCASNNSPCEH